MTAQDAGTFLTRILDHKRAEVALRRAQVPQHELVARIAAAPPVRPLDAALRRPGSVALIAEVKKASPSKGVLIENFDPLALAGTYAAHGAAAISVLTDEQFFQGSLEYLQQIRTLMQPASDQRPKTKEDSALGSLSLVLRPVPLLRKDFIIDAYQVYEARAHGADALLLIVAALADAPLRELLALTHALGMQALVEVHDEAELDRALAAGARVVGVNNRDLHSFVTSLDTTRRVAARLPAADRPLLVSESGIFTREHVAQVRDWGADAILVGEALVKSADIGAHVRELAGMARS
ncbi:MAG TPA: indole-3-glycerol phosphate synthase TrpC [Kouleothrix sp.]|uniref:indole-3-glycerol phosphate synthase TrpC n=1 Tax=Kouleothrix sp. TaxID=2779161 RepID=UPI002B8B2627|nr:indole-3-glycerol phosphate synthase TrpC [Kouleothrix sp.]